ncbi:MAG TPA: site-specific integrase [Pyrinomonadaceae bacterium]
MAKRTGIKKLPSGRFRARYFKGYDTITGKRVYPARTFDTEREARDWLSGEWNAKDSSSVEGRGVTVAKYMDHWLTTKLKIRDNTRHTYEATINRYIRPTLGRLKLSRLTASDVEQWQVDLLKRLQPTTVATARTLLYGALNNAKKKNIIRSNVVEVTESPAHGTSKPKRYALTIEEALRFLETCQGSEFGLFFELMLTCGLRPEEALGVRWADIDLSGSRGVMRIQQVIHRVKGGGWKLEAPKTTNSERTIVIPNDLTAKLTDHRKVQLEKQLKAGPYWQAHDLVFCDPSGEPLGYVRVYRWFKKVALKHAELPQRVKPYDLRHAFVTFSLIAGVDAKTVSREAGHAKVAFTLDRYGDVLEEMHVTATDKREELMKSRTKAGQYGR